MRAGLPCGLHSRQPRAGRRARCFDGKVSVVAGFFGFLTLRHLLGAAVAVFCCAAYLTSLTKPHLIYLWFFAVRCALGGEVRAGRLAFLAFLCLVLTVLAGQIVRSFLRKGICCLMRFCALMN